MRALVVNAGSSTLKLRVIGEGDRLDAEMEIDPWDGDEAQGALWSAVGEVGPVDAAGHRVVHGGTDLVGPVRVDDDVQATISDLAPLAPLHQPWSLAALAAARLGVARTSRVACFDTAFHATMPAAAYYALPATWRHRWGLGKFGFHGLSHAWVARHAPAVLADNGAHRRIVSCHLGAGSSLCAILDGRSVDTTMGFTPLEGLVMATRSGSVDPGLVLWLIAGTGLGVGDVQEGLEQQAGLAGLSGTSGDMRGARRLGCGDESAQLAFDVYVHRLRHRITAMTPALGGVGVLAFTGGIGEHAAPVLGLAVAGLRFLGLELDENVNAEATGDADLTGVDGVARTVVVTARTSRSPQVRQLLR